MLLVQGQFCMLVMPEILWMPQLAKSTTVSCWLGCTTRLRLAGRVDSKRRKLGQVWKLVLPEVEQKLLTQWKLIPPSWLSCGMAWMQVRQRQEVGLTTSLLYNAMQSGQRFLLEELRENMRLEMVMVVLELKGKRLGTVLLQTVLALMVILKQLGVWKQVTRQALLVSAFQKLACRSQQCEFWSKLEEMTTLGLKKRSMQELELVAMELMLWQMLILKVWEASMVEEDLTSSIELKVLSQKVWQKVEGATALFVTSPEYRQDEAVKAVMTAVVSMQASIQNKLAVVIFIWKVTETTVPMTMGPMPEMTKEAAEQVQEGVQVSDWKLEQAVPAIMLAFWRTILMLQRSGTEQGMEICSCTNWLMFWQNCMGPEMGALQGRPRVSVSGQLTVAMGQSISQASRGVRVLQLRLQMEMLVAAMMKGLLIWLICTMNLRPTANCSLKISTKMFGETIWQERMAGAAQSAIGLVEYRLDWKALGMEPREKVKGYCMTKMKVESEVEMACPMVTSALRVEVEPGALLLRVLRMLTPMRLVMGGLLTTDPKLELASQTSPLQLRVYISMLGDIFCMLGTTLQRCSWREQTVLGSRLLCTRTATVLLVASSGLSLSTCAVVMVRGKVGAARLVHAMAMEELTRMQLQGSRLVLYQSMVTSRQELLGSAFAIVKGRMQIEGEFSVSGQRPMLPAGARASAEATSRSKKGNATLGINIMIYIQLTIIPL